MNNRVVITGVGIVSAIGTGKKAFTAALMAGESGIKTITRFSTAGYRVSVAGEVAEEHLPRLHEDRCLSFCLAAAREAMEDSGLAVDSLDPRRFGVAIASSLGCVDALRDYIKARAHDGKSPGLDTILRVPHSAPSSEVGRRYGCQGPSFTVDTACASGSNSIGFGFQQIKNGQTDCMIAGGVDVLSELSFSGFSSMMNLSRTLCRPFDQGRDGLVLGEGCGIVVLENYAHAQSRGARIYAEILGYGLANDAYHETKPDPAARGAILSMEMALKEAGILPADISYVNAHGTGTKYNDQMELTALKAVFAQHVAKLKVSSIKAALGHTLGAAGSVELVATAIGMDEGRVPPTINFQTPVEGAELIDFVPLKGISQPIPYAMSNSFGFAGNCSSIVLGACRQNKPTGEKP